MKRSLATLLTLLAVLTLAVGAAGSAHASSVARKNPPAGKAAPLDCTFLKEELRNGQLDWYAKLRYVVTDRSGRSRVKTVRTWIGYMKSRNQTLTVGRQTLTFRKVCRGVDSATSVAPFDYSTCTDEQKAADPVSHDPCTWKSAGDPAPNEWGQEIAQAETDCAWAVREQETPYACWGLQKDIGRYALPTSFRQMYPLPADFPSTWAPIPEDMWIPDPAVFATWDGADWHLPDGSIHPIP